jgi:hypothetical protein
MPYSELTSFQFERGKGFTEESVLSFRVLALNVIDELMRHDGVTVAHFPLSNDEVRLVLDYRTRKDADDEPESDDLGSDEPESDDLGSDDLRRENLRSENLRSENLRSDDLHGVAPRGPAAPTDELTTLPVVTAATDSSTLSEHDQTEEALAAAQDTPGESMPTTEDEFEIAARWLALATRGDYDLHQESPEQKRA